MTLFRIDFFEYNIMKNTFFCLLYKEVNPEVFGSKSHCLHLQSFFFSSVVNPASYTC